MGLINMYKIMQLKLKSPFKLARDRVALSPLELYSCYDINISFSKFINASALFFFVDFQYIVILKGPHTLLNI